jgi:hypothetical protein
MVCQDKATAEESTQLAKEWIEEHASELGLKPTHDRPGFCPRSDNVGRTRAKNGRGSSVAVPVTRVAFLCHPHCMMRAMPTASLREGRLPRGKRPQGSGLVSRANWSLLRKGRAALSFP